MSQQRRIRRQNQRQINKHFSKLGEMLTGFYCFLERKPQPTNEEVRSRFIKDEQEWKSYCRKHQLNSNTFNLFNYEVGKAWRTRYAASNQN